MLDQGSGVLIKVKKKSITCCIRVLWRNRAYRIHTHTRTHTRFIIGIGLPDYGGQEVPQTALCKPETRSTDGLIQPHSEGLRTRRLMFESRYRKNQILPSWTFLSIQPLKGFDDTHHPW